MIDLSSYRETKWHRRARYLFFTFLHVPILSTIITGIAYLLTPPIIPPVAFVGVFLALWWGIYRLFIRGALNAVIRWLRKNKDESRYSSGGRARFAGMFEEPFDVARKKYSIYVGRSMFSRLWEHNWKSELHLTTIAGSRSGKGAAQIIPNLLRFEGSAIVIDPKGTNTHVTATHRRRMGQNVYILDPLSDDPIGTDTFNPLDTVDVESVTAFEDIIDITEAIIPVAADEKSAHFDDNAVALFAGYIVHVMTSGNYENPSLIDVMDIIDLEVDEQLEILAEMRVNEAVGGLAKKAAKRVLAGVGKDEQHSNNSTLKRKTRWLASNGYRRFLSTSTFTPELLKTEPGTVYLVIPPKLIDKQAGFLRLFLNVVLGKYLTGERAKIPTLFIIDEAPALKYLSKIVNAYKVNASYNMMMWTFWQSKGDIDQHYGAEGRNYIGSARLTQAFAVDPEDAKWIAEMFGTQGMTDDVTRTTSVMGFRDAASVQSELAAPEYPREKWFGKVYNMKRGGTWLLSENIPYFRSARFAPLASPDPDHPNTHLPLFGHVMKFWFALKQKVTIKKRTWPDPILEKTCLRRISYWERQLTTIHQENIISEGEKRIAAAKSVANIIKKIHGIYCEYNDPKTIDENVFYHPKNIGVTPQLTKFAADLILTASTKDSEKYDYLEKMVAIADDLNAFWEQETGEKFRTLNDDNLNAIRTTIQTLRAQI